jgi:hypothetical protein
MLRILKSMVLLAVVAIPAWAQQPQDSAVAPIPAQIGSAKKVFVSNAGAESVYRLPKDAMYSGGPNRTYNQFYGALKSWGRFELVSAPADADLVFTIGFSDKNEGATFVSEFKLVVLDPKTHVALWTFTQYADPAGMAKNREKNYDLAMTALIEDLRGIVAPPAPAASK